MNVRTTVDIHFEVVEETDEEVTKERIEEEMAEYKHGLMSGLGITPDDEFIENYSINVEVVKG